MRLLDHDDLVLKGIKKSKWQIYRDVREGRFVPPIRHGGRNLWVEGEVDAWIKARMAERDANIAVRRAANPKNIWPVAGESAAVKKARRAVEAA